MKYRIQQSEARLKRFKEAKTAILVEREEAILNKLRSKTWSG